MNRRLLTTAAVVLGTALTAAGPASAAADAPPGLDDISRYCQACWRNARLPADRWGDCTQQVFVRLLERLDRDRWTAALADDGAERRELLRAIDAVKKRTQRARVAAPLATDVTDVRYKGADALRDRREELARAAAAVLSDRQRRIVELTCGGWAVPEIAAALGTTEARVSDEKYKAVRKLRAAVGDETA